MNEAERHEQIRAVVADLDHGQASYLMRRLAHAGVQSYSVIALAERAAETAPSPYWRDHYLRWADALRRGSVRIAPAEVVDRELIALYLAVQVTALTGAFAFSRPTDTWGPKKVVTLSLLLWSAVAVAVSLLPLPSVTVRVMV